jgi:hypothetical protein
MLLLWLALLGGSFVLLVPTILFLVFAPFWGALVYILLAGFHIIEQHKRQKL